MAPGKILSFLRSHDKGRNENKTATQSSRIHPKHAELGKKKTAEAESHHENRKKESAGPQNQTVNQSDGKENSRSFNITGYSEGNYPEITTLGRENRDFSLKREKWCLQEQFAEKDKKISELEAQIAEMQKKHREEVRSLEEEKRSVIRELCRTIAHYKDRLKFKLGRPAQGHSK